MLFKLFVFKLIVLAVKLNLVSGLDKKSHCTCKENVQANIVGGRTIKFNHLPWMASVTDSGFHKYNQPTNPPNDDYKIKDHKCTAFVLNELWVITTKTCTLKENSVYSVGFGYDKVEMFGKKIRVKKVHPNEDPNVDISLLELTEPINFDENLRPACIDTKKYEKIKHEKPTLLAAGFGKNAKYMMHKKSNRIFFYNKEKGINEDENIATNIDSRYLKEVDMIDITNREQNFMIYAQNKITSHTVCMGDEGGPLHYTHDGRKFVIGLLKEYRPLSPSRTSFEDYCTKITIANYLKIEPHIKWIKKKLASTPLYENYCDDNVVNEVENSSQKILRLFGTNINVDRNSEDDPKGKRQKL